MLTEVVCLIVLGAASIFWYATRRIRWKVMLDSDRYSTGVSGFGIACHLTRDIDGAGLIRGYAPVAVRSGDKSCYSCISNVPVIVLDHQTFHGSDATSIAIAAHEAGHAHHICEMNGWESYFESCGKVFKEAATWPIMVLVATLGIITPALTFSILLLKTIMWCAALASSWELWVEARANIWANRRLLFGDINITDQVYRKARNVLVAGFLVYVAITSFSVAVALSWSMLL